MTTTARDYLVNRFETDAAVLRERVALMARGTKVPGPDASTSGRMADACDEVVAMLMAIASHGDASAELDAIMALVPLLERRATEQQSNPAVRSVYAGAATRIREIRSAEAQSAQADGIPSEALDGTENPDDELEHDDDLDDLDDDDVDDDVIDFDEDDDSADGSK
ncbi:hypothetical protein [Gemmatimonas groenlandica]|uniref:Uncharacterized protein n=1 Tax=Gemmatimonas groenlandica TaxID=2732249 RepID=A0A6M4II79_9BACT|nr:hypothetical protein [Gemmatimonas groenlandica]QJR34330.1 hypothetical protein HKW67_01725 [Gemmatimonas groenlandica]